jgi:Uncharacterized ACR, COG1678
MSSVILNRSLFRALLRSCKPFSSPSPLANVFSALLQRSETGNDRWNRSKFDLDKDTLHDVDDGDILGANGNEHVDNNKENKSTTSSDHRSMFTSLLREVFHDTGDIREMQFPSQVKSNILRQLVIREFRSRNVSDNTAERQKLAFLALRELNKILNFAEPLRRNRLGNLNIPESWNMYSKKAAKHVSKLPLIPSEYLKPGTFLLAHPLLTGYFKQTVICILSHSNSNLGGTYGLIVNRETHPLQMKTSMPMTLDKVLRFIPPQLVNSFGQSPVRDGGPVHMSLQMIYSTPTLLEQVGGIALDIPSEETLTDLSKRNVFFQGDVLQAATAVHEGRLNKGTSCNLYPILSPFLFTQ